MSESLPGERQQLAFALVLPRSFAIPELKRPRGSLAPAQTALLALSRVRVTADNLQ